MFRLRIALIGAIGLLTACGKKEDGKTSVGADSAQTIKAVTRPVQPQKIVALGRIEPEAKIVSLASEVAGVAKRLYVREGETVRAGQLILELTNDVELAQVNQLRAKFATQQNQIATDRANLESAMLKTDNLRRTFDRLQKIYEGGGETKQNRDNAETDALTAEKDVARLKAAVAASESKLAEQQADLAVAQAQYERRFIKAPTDGTVLQLDAKVGAAITQNQSFAEFAPTGPVTALCEVDEMFAAEVKPGQPAYVRTQGANDTLVVGEVIFAAPQLKKKSLFSGVAGDPEDRRVREVRIRLHNGGKLLFNARIEGVVLLKDAKSF
jgi:multidrug resistance efflux pump